MEDNEFIITELGGARRTIRLVNRGLPYRPFSLKTRQRVEVTWYPGSPEAEVTVLGGSFDGTKLTGAWKEMFIGVDASADAAPITVDGSQVRTVAEAHELMSSICHAGQVLLVAWNGMTRRGVLTEWDVEWTTRYDFDWSAAFEWIGTGDAPLRAPSEMRAASLESSATSLKVEADKADKLFSEPPVGLADAPATDVARNIALVSAHVSALNSVASGLYGAVQPPGSAAQRAASALLAVARDAGAAESALTAAPTALLFARVETIGERNAARAYARAVARQLRRVRYSAALARARVVERENSASARVHRVRDGEDLRSISRLYYGTPFNWRELMRHNNLETVTLRPGQVLAVPFTLEAV